MHYLLVLPRRNIKNNVISRYLLNTIMGQAYTRGDQEPSRARPLRGLPFAKMRHMYTIYQGNMADARAAIQVMVPEVLRI